MKPPRFQLSSPTTKCTNFRTPNGKEILAQNAERTFTPPPRKKQPNVLFSASNVEVDREHSGDITRNQVVEKNLTGHT